MLKKAISRIPGFRLVIRIRIAFFYFGKTLKNLFFWICLGKEESNFYYDLTPLNRNQLISSVAVMLETDFETIKTYVDEIENNKKFYADLESFLFQAAESSPKRIYIGRRIAWYAIVRHTKPKVVVETGVAQGLGSCVIACAINQNSKEGFPGEYFGTDIDQSAGILFRGEYAHFGKILYGDSLQTLAGLNRQIDVFINDSDHDSGYEYMEYITVSSKLSEKAVIIGDNAHASDSLLKFSIEKGRKFVFIPERPLDHWYPGAGVGVSVR